MKKEKLSKREMLQLLEKMLVVRAFEEKTGELFGQKIIPGFIHLSIGEEASSVGTCSVLRKDDYVASTHRGHGHLIAKGADPKFMFAELFAKATGYCKGKGGSMHIADFSLGILGANGVVGGGFPDYCRRGSFHQGQENRPGGSGLFWRRRSKPRDFPRGSKHGSYLEAPGHLRM